MWKERARVRCLDGCRFVLADWISPLHFIFCFPPLRNVEDSGADIEDNTTHTYIYPSFIFPAQHYLHNEYHLSCLSSASSRQARGRDICDSGQPSCNVVGSGCGCILWSHIQFFHRPMFSFWMSQLSRAERGCLRYVHAGLIDQKGIFLTCQNERTNERTNAWTKLTKRRLSQDVNHLRIDGHAAKMRAGGRLPRPLVGPQMLVQHTKCEVRQAAAFPPNLICGSTRESAGVIFLSPSDKQADKAWEPPDAAAPLFLLARPPLC